MDMSVYIVAKLSRNPLIDAYRMKHVTALRTGQIRSLSYPFKTYRT